MPDSRLPIAQTDSSAPESPALPRARGEGDRRDLGAAEQRSHGHGACDEGGEDPPRHGRAAPVRPPQRHGRRRAGVTDQNGGADHRRDRGEDQPGGRVHGRRQDRDEGRADDEDELVEDRLVGERRAQLGPVVEHVCPAGADRGPDLREQRPGDHGAEVGPRAVGARLDRERPARPGRRCSPLRREPARAPAPSGRCTVPAPRRRSRWPAGTAPRRRPPAGRSRSGRRRGARCRGSPWPWAAGRRARRWRTPRHRDGSAPGGTARGRWPPHSPPALSLGAGPVGCEVMSSTLGSRDRRGTAPAARSRGSTPSCSAG